MKDNVNLNERTSRSQASMILDHMIQGNRITGIDALTLYGCFRLPARIADIKEDGWPVQSEFVTTPSGKRVKSYFLVTETSK